MKMRGKRVGYMRNIGAKTGNIKHCAGWPGCIDGCEGDSATRSSEKREYVKEINSQLDDNKILED